MLSQAITQDHSGFDVKHSLDEVHYTMYLLPDKLPAETGPDGSHI
jgi:hypothetical protein